jgi:Bacterial Ig-like domain (group 3)/FG-GAP-like repeat
MSLRALTHATSLLFSFFALVLSVIAPGVMATSDIFHAARNYRAGDSSRVVRIGDFNNDGKLDLAVATDAGLAVLLNKGDGTYDAPVFLACGSLAVVAGDFNNDGNLDLFLSSSSPCLLLGNGDGTFRKTQPAVDTATTAVAGDFNNDGNLDLAFPGTDSLGNLTVVVNLGNGNGTFQPSKISNSGLTGTPGPPLLAEDFMAVGDFNGDGKLDWTVLTASSSLFVFFGNGDGTFKFSARYISVPGNTVVVADLNGDGKPDLAVGADGIGILLNDGDGTFGPATIIPTNGGVFSIALGDFNSDGHLDFAVHVSIELSAGGQTDRLGVLLGKPDGTFRPEVDYPATAENLALGDVDGDGNVDIVTANGITNDVSVFRGFGDGTFQSAKSYRTGGIDPKAVAVADFNGDGNLDLVTVNKKITTFPDRTAVMSLLLGNGDGTFQLPKVTSLGGFSTLETTSGHLFITSGDFNRDGKPDLAICGSSPAGDLVEALLGNGDGTFISAWSFTFPSSPDAPKDIAVRDVNGDGFPDLAVARTTFTVGGAGTGTGSVNVFLNNGDGTFRGPAIYGSGPAFRSVRLRDINDDGKVDVIATGDDGTFAMLGNGNGTFQSATRVGPPGLSVAVGDLNHDGKADLALADFTNPADFTNSVSILLGNGNGTFQTAVGYLLYAPATVVKAADVNGDNNQDIIVGTNSGLSVLLGKGDGTFLPAIDYGTGSEGGQGDFAGHNFGLGDFNSDGAVDLVTSGVGTRFVSVLLNQRGTFLHSSRSANPSKFGQAVTFRTTVTASLKGFATPTGSVTFKDGSTILGTSALSAGKASLTTSTLSVGTHTIRVFYSGDSNFNAHEVSAFTQTVQ